MTTMMTTVNYFLNNNQKKHKSNNNKSDTLGKTIKIYRKFMVQMLTKSN